MKPITALKRLYNYYLYYKKKTIMKTKQLLTKMLLVAVGMLAGTGTIF